MAAYTNFPTPKFLFEVTIDGVAVPFQEVTGLDQEYEFLEYRSGEDADLATRKRSGLYKSGQVSFKKGLFKGKDDVWKLWDHLFSGKDKKFRAEKDPIDIVVKLLDETKTGVMEWKIEGAVPIKLSNADLKSDENAIAIEQIDFVFSRINSKYL